MSDENDRIFKKLEDLDGRLDKIDITLAAQHVVLTEHVRRTEILENQMEPIKSHVATVGAIGKIIFGLGALVALVLGIKQIFNM